MCRPGAGTSAWLLACGLMVGTGAAARSSGEEAALRVERLVWADPELAGVQLRSRRDVGGREVVVEASAPTAALAKRLRERLRSEAGVEDFQVVVDPRLPRPGPPAEDEAEALEAARRAVAADPATRRAAGALVGARLADGATLELDRPVELEPALERRFARLLLAQPGIHALRWPRSAPPRAPTARVDAPLRTPREAAPAQDLPLTPPSGEEEPGEASAADALAAGGRQEAPAATEGLDAHDAPTPVIAADAGSSAEHTPGTEELAAPSEPSSAGRPEPAADGGRAAARDKVDAAVEELLRRALELEGAGGGVHVRVVQGVATYSGRVESRELADRLRSLTRSFDGIVRVTGSLALPGGSERVPMDALPD